ncbi:P-loop containing nucleoside triphosphate hydrolase protein [Endogone sp. FLAS-F59071]|nr:P-loop containing nucleoside triphosphate hydrolase protein [Endogone sp. FLAS-F59071]|eukprot:RUS16233.1 P-loop containing nucleoside triphosphate hydrolase protein [Endogone sp. FLAS-F59071]
MSGKKGKSDKPAEKGKPSPKKGTDSPSSSKPPVGRAKPGPGGNKGSPSTSENTAANTKEPKQLFDGWTGKTPVSLLYEFCQKQGWEKPIFEMGSFREGFVCTTVIGKLNKKSGQIETLKMSPPYVYKPTPIEARHLSATYVLFRVNSNMPMYRILPPDHRDYWMELEEAKQREVAQGQGWRYAPDPFTAKAPERLSAGGSATNDKTKSNSPTPSGRSSPSPKFGTVPRDDDGMDEKTRKYWESLPMVDMSAENRTLVEDVVKKLAEIYPINDDSDLTQSQKSKLQSSLVRMGFRLPHIEEALEYCRDEATALDWLCKFVGSGLLGVCASRLMGMDEKALRFARCLHVPEDDLPPRFLKANYNPTMRTISHTPSTLGRDWTLQRMATIGFPLAACDEALDEGGNDEIKALQVLQWRLVHGDEERPSEPDTAAFDLEELETGRLEEVMALESIFDTRFERTEEFAYRILIPPRNDADDTDGIVSGRGKGKQDAPVYLEAQIPPKSAYPHVLPILIVRSEGLPAYIKLAAMKELLREAEANFIGMSMVYMCADWLDTHLWDIVEHPPKLREVTGGFTRIQLDAATEEGDSKPKVFWTRNRDQTSHGHNRNELRESSEALLAALRQMHTSPAYQPIKQVREKLPAHGFHDNIVEAVRKNQVVIVSGETGCGKTTQVPQFILDTLIEEGKGQGANILCTQPRRISAMGVAERVASERCGKIGGTVGYAIRGETKTSAQTRLLFCTTGVLLRRLQSDPKLTGVSHVMVDEVHERSVDSDFLLIILRELLKRRADLKLVLMSATINQELFSAYFGNAPAIEIPGFTHPVQEHYLEDILRRTRHVSSLPTPKRSKDDEGDTWRDEYAEQGYDEATIRALEPYRNSDKIDYNLIAATVKSIVEEEEEKGLEEFGGGAILIFLTVIIFHLMIGVMEIKRCIDTLESSLPRSKQYQILPLHASLSPQEQNKVFKPTAKGTRKIVVATNVAETSITIDGVVYVIDSGRVKETQYDPANNMTNLVETWTSREFYILVPRHDNVEASRAGRTRPGQCFRLYTRTIEAKKMPAQQTPEMLRIPLEQLALSVKAMGEHDVQRFLKKAINPPSTEALKTAIQTLLDVGALREGSGVLTALGKHMATIPADLRISKMLLFGAIFRCLDRVLTLAAIMSVKSPFVSPMDKREEANAARKVFTFAKSDWLTDLKAYEAWDEQGGHRAAREFCDQNFLSRNTLLEISALREQYLDALSSIGFINTSIADCSVNANNVNLLKAVLFAGLYPNVIRVNIPDAKYDQGVNGTVERDREAKEIKFYVRDQGRVFIHPSSILFHVNNYSPPFLVYFSRMTTSKTFIRDGTEVSNSYVL